MQKLYLKSRTRSNITARNETTIFFLSKCFTFHDRFANTDHFELAHVSARKVTFYLSRASKLMLVPRKKAHRSFVNASRCLARVKQVREAFATRPDCRYNDSPFLTMVLLHDFVSDKLKSSPLRLCADRNTQLVLIFTVVE